MMPSATKSASTGEPEIVDQLSSSELPKKSLHVSYILLAVAAVVGLDLAARMFYHPDRFESPNRSWAYWAVRAFHSQPKPDVVVFGSSLMLAVLNDGDSTYLNQPFDSVTHHKAFYLNHLLEKSLKKPVNSSTMAIGGQMASDVYVLTRNLLNKQTAPKIIVWGIAPRDFVDSSFTDPDNSETVRYFKKVTGSDNVLGRYRHIIWNDIQNIIDRTCYLYGHRADITATAIQLSKIFLTTACGAKELDTVKAPKPLLHYAMLNLPEDNGLKQWQVTPYTPNRHFEDNTEEYKQRYRPFRPRVLSTQLGYFARMLKLANQDGSKVLIVNMPITRGNLELLPEGIYNNYLGQVQRVATAGGASFVDLNKDGLFPADQFADTVHLNGKGGMRFFDLTAPQISAALSAR